MSSKRQEDIRSLCDLHSAHAAQDIAQMYGTGPLEPNAKPREPVKRQPYDELYLKQKANRDYWSGK